MRKVKILAAFSAAVLSLALLAGCGGSGGSSAPSPGTNVTQPSVSGSSQFAGGPATGDAIQLNIVYVGGAQVGTTGGSTTTTSTIGGPTPVKIGGFPEKLTGTLVIAGSHGMNGETIALSGSTDVPAQGTAIINYQLTGTDPSSGTTYTVTGNGDGAGPIGLTGSAATVTSSSGDSGTVNLS